MCLLGGHKDKDSLGTLIWWGLTTGRGGEASPASSEEGLVPVPDLSQLHFGEAEGLERWCLSDKHSLTYHRVVVAESGRVGGPSVCGLSVP